MEFLIGIFVGALLYYVFGKRRDKPSGTFVIDLTDPTKDVCNLELSENLNDIYMKKQIILNIKIYEDNSLN